MDMVLQVPAANIAAMWFSLAVAFGLPIGLFWWLRKKKQAQMNPFFIGCAVFVLFALILEQILHAIVLSAAGELLTNNIWLYALYGGAAAGLFEEGGRYLAMKKVMQEKRNILTRDNALMYGAGHGGAEAIMLVGVTYINNLIVAFLINSGSFASTLAQGDEASQAAMLQSVRPLMELTPPDFCIAGIERIMAIALQIALSVVVYQAVRLGKKGYLAAAFGLHFGVDAITLLVARFIPAMAVEGVVLVMTVLVCLYAYRLYRLEEVQTA